MTMSATLLPLNPGACHRGLTGISVPPTPNPMFPLFAVAGLFSAPSVRAHSCTRDRQLSNRITMLPSVGCPDFNKARILLAPIIASLSGKDETGKLQTSALSK